jgi:hypothetical protein
MSDKDISTTLIPRQNFVCTVVIAVLAATFCVGLQAAENSDGWEWRLTPLYYWSLNIRGNQSSGSDNPPVDVDRFDFAFEGAFSANLEGIRNDRWGFYADIIWTDLSNTDNKDGSRLDFRYGQAEFDALYRTAVGNHTFDWLAGLRYYNNKFEQQPAALKGNEDWVDPLIGVRWKWPFAESLTLTLRGDIGGFGVGSDWSWQVLALMDWHPWEHVSITGGVRTLTVDYSNGDGSDFFVYDITMWGPVLGVSFRW